MAHVVADRVKETTNTTGTGTITLAGAVSGFQSFSVIGNGNTTPYSIISGNGTDWECGIGTYTSAGTTLSRSVMASSNGGSAISLTGTSTVFVSYIASKSVHCDNAGTVNLTASGSSVVPLIVKGAASQSVNLTNWKNSSDTTIAYIASDGRGIFANMNTIANTAVILGDSVTNSTSQAVVIGNTANSGGGQVTIGYGATGSVGCITLGNGASAGATNLFTAGSATYPINTVVFGKGYSHGAPSTYTITGTIATGANTAGGGITISPGTSTGNATPAKITFRGTATGSSGSTAQTLVDVLVITNSTTVTFSDGVNMAFNTTTGTKIGTATTQKIGFYNVTPVIQQASADQTALTDSTGGSTVTYVINDVGVTHDRSTLNNNFAKILVLLNRLRNDLVTVGLIKGSA